MGLNERVFFLRKAREAERLAATLPDEQDPLTKLGYLEVAVTFETVSGERVELTLGGGGGG